MVWFSCLQHISEPQGWLSSSEVPIFLLNERHFRFYLFKITFSYTFFLLDCISYGHMHGSVYLSDQVWRFAVNVRRKLSPEGPFIFFP